MTKPHAGNKPVSYIIHSDESMEKPYSFSLVDGDGNVVKESEKNYKTASAAGSAASRQVKSSTPKGTEEKNSLDKNCMICSEGTLSFIEKQEENIRKYGHSIIITRTAVLTGVVNMAYTVGLCDKKLPEIVTFGLPVETSQNMLNKAAAMLVRGEIPLDTPVKDICNLPVIFKAVTPKNGYHYIIQANNRANKSLCCLQMVWPDLDGKFPWDPEFEKSYLPFQPPLYED